MQNSKNNEKVKNEKIKINMKRERMNKYGVLENITNFAKE